MRPEEYTDDDVVEYLVNRQVGTTEDMIRSRMERSDPKHLASAFAHIKTIMSLKGWVPSVR
jgi:hypothetical protein